MRSDKTVKEGNTIGLSRKENVSPHNCTISHGYALKNVTNLSLAEWYMPDHREVECETDVVVCSLINVAQNDAPLESAEPPDPQPFRAAASTLMVSRLAYLGLNSNYGCFCCRSRARRSTFFP